MTTRTLLIALTLFSAACTEMGGKGANDDTGGSAGSGGEGGGGEGGSGSGEGGSGGSGGGGGGGAPACESSGFEEDATNWSLPQICDQTDDGNPGCYTFSNYILDRDDNEVSYSVFDITGDGIPDVVATLDDNETEKRVGREAWHVFPGGTKGFQDGILWDLPDICDQTDDSDYACYQTSNYLVERDDDEVSYSLFDITGDGQLDMVATLDDNVDDARIGREAWFVWPGGSSGFEDGIVWDLPDICDQNDGSEYACSVTSNYLTEHDDDEVSYSLFDITGDGQLDMVATLDGNVTDARIGREAWFVWPGGSSGFDDGILWSLPDICDQNDGSDYACSASSNYLVERDDDVVTYSIFDITGDGIIDMVATLNDNEDDKRIGREAWFVWPGGSKGFEDGFNWDLPDICDQNDGSDYACYQTSNYLVERDDDVVTYAIFDITGDGIIDMVATLNDNVEEARIGREAWYVWPGGAEGFEGGFVWDLPSFCDQNDGSDYACYQTSNYLVERDEDEVYFTILDLNGDGALDMVRTVDDNLNDDDIGRNNWALNAANCTP